MDNDGDDFEYSESIINAARELSKLQPKGSFEHHRKVEEAKIRRIINKVTGDSEQKRNGLLNRIPATRRHKEVVKMATLLIDNGLVENYLLAKCIDYRLTLKKYIPNHKDYKKLIQNRLRTLKKYWRKTGYDIKHINIPVDSYQLISSK